MAAFDQGDGEGLNTFKGKDKFLIKEPHKRQVSAYADSKGKKYKQCKDFM